MEMLIGYMYSGQVSVTQDDIVPLLSAAKTLGVKGLLDVPLPNSEENKEQPSSPKLKLPPAPTRPRAGPPPLKKLKHNFPNPVKPSSHSQILQQQLLKTCDTKQLKKELKSGVGVKPSGDDVNHDLSEEGVDPLDNNGDLTDQVSSHSISVLEARFRKGVVLADKS